MAEWEIWLDDPQGNRIKVLDYVIDFTVSKVTNQSSPCVLTLSKSADFKTLRWDSVIEFWRTPNGGSKKLFNIYFLRYKGVFDDRNGRETLVLKGYDPLYLIGSPSGYGRIVAYDADNAKTKMTDQADDMLKAIVTDNLGADNTDSDRNLTSDGLTVEGDLADGVSMTRAFAWQEMMPLFQDIAEDCRQQGTNLYFEFLPSFGSDGLLDLKFITRTDQPRQDRTWDSKTPVYFGKLWGNLSDAYYYEDRIDEVNTVYAGGRGLGAARDVQEIEDTERSQVSIWNRREGFAYATDQAATAGVTSRGKAYLEEHRPVKRFGGRLLDAGEFRYGIDWNWGDKVTCEYHGMQFDAIVKAVTIHVNENGQEEMDCTVEVEE